MTRGICILPRILSNSGRRFSLQAAEAATSTGRYHRSDSITAIWYRGNPAGSRRRIKASLSRPQRRCSSPYEVSRLAPQGLPPSWRSSLNRLAAAPLPGHSGGRCARFRPCAV